MKTIALIPAAGVGARMGGVKKSYMDLLGSPVLCHTLRVFDSCPSIDAVIIAVRTEDVEYCKKEIVEGHGVRKVIGVVAGGESRQDSVAAALSAAADMGFDVVAVHDGARPLVPVEVVEEVVRRAAETRAAIAAVPVKDTIKEVVRNTVARTVDRQSLHAIQTPQAFWFDDLKAAIDAAAKDGFCGTDESMLMERLGYPVSVVMGSYDNIKITTPEDIIIAEAILKRREL